MTKEELERLLEIWENHFVEFKEKIDCDACFIEDILALSNNEAEKSFYILGIKDKTKEIIGTDKTKEDLQNKLKDLLSRLPRIDYGEIIIDDKKVLTLTIHSKLEAPYFYEKEQNKGHICHICGNKGSVCFGLFITRNGASNRRGDFNTLERLFKKRLGVNLSPKEKLENIFKHNNFENEFEDPANFTERDKMQEDETFAEKKVVLLKSDYDFRVRFWDKKIRFPQTKEEDDFVRNQIEDLLEKHAESLPEEKKVLWKMYEEGKLFWKLYDPLELFDGLRHRNSKDLKILNEIFKAMSLQNEDFSNLLQENVEVFKKAFSYLENGEEFFKDVFEKKNFTAIKNVIEELFPEIIDRIDDLSFIDSIRDLLCTNLPEYIDFKLRDFYIYLNYFNDKKFDDIQIISRKVKYLVDYKDRKLEEGCFYELRIKYDKLFLPPLKNFKEMKGFWYAVKSSNDYKTYELFCKKFNKTTIEIEEMPREYENHENRELMKQILKAKHFKVEMFLYLSNILIFETEEEALQFEKSFGTNSEESGKVLIKKQFTKQFGEINFDNFLLQKLKVDWEKYLT